MTVTEERPLCKRQLTAAMIATRSPVRQTNLTEGDPISKPEEDRPSQTADAGSVNVWQPADVVRVTGHHCFMSRCLNGDLLSFVMLTGN